MKSSQLPLTSRLHTRYKAGTKGANREGELIPKNRSQFGLQSATRLHEVGVASNADQHAAGYVPGLVHTARHTTKVGTPNRRPTPWRSLRRWLAMGEVSSRLRGVTGGVYRPGTYSPQRADLRLLATPTSAVELQTAIRTETGFWDSSPSRVCNPCTGHCSACAALGKGMRLDFIPTFLRLAPAVSHESPALPAGNIGQGCARCGTNPTSHDTADDSHAPPVYGAEAHGLHPLYRHVKPGKVLRVASNEHTLRRLCGPVIPLSLALRPYSPGGALNALATARNRR